MEDAALKRPDGGVAGGEAESKVTSSASDGSATQGHRRSLSGSILNSLPFIGGSAKGAETESPPKREQEGHVEVANEGRGNSSMAKALHQSQGRKRKGSLRKAAMFGTGKILRERRNSSRTSAPKPPQVVSTQMSPESGEEETVPQRFNYESPSLNSSSDSGWPPVETLSISINSNPSLESQDATPRVLAAPLTSPVGHYASTTDDDEGLSFFRPIASGSSSYTPVQMQVPGAASSLQRRRSNRSGQHSSLPTVHAPVDATLDDEWDYSETEWWGWVVLIVTWIVFVVGMGSCLGIWSWAWDVGETPYAPPELEDDPTLPITGYYPALMVCTAVMAWVWVVVAWVGMKYFRHAKEG